MSIQTKDLDMTLTHLKADDYHEICGLTETVKTKEADRTDHTFAFSVKTGEMRTEREDWKNCILYSDGDLVKTDSGVGRISGWAVEKGKVTPFARVNGRLYHVRTLQRA